MKLSIVIVNYNVKHFLEQCLLSVQRALQGIPAEVFVVDNNSVDGSIGMLREKFPWVKLLANKENVGFARANNQAIRQSLGEYVLLLNPDTVVEEDTFRKTLAWLDAHPACGGLGLKMVNGKGEFLPESKRALPTPWVAFYKVFGFSRLFPKSKRFGKYHLTYLDKDQNHEVEVLSGACMFLRRAALDKVGLLDEDYFMYGEDIDLSYRITQGGYTNCYFSETQIIHYKGESTRKGSLNYVLVFYNAMLIFARKHFSHGRRRLFMFLIQLAIYFRAALAIGRRIVQRTAFPLLEWGIIYALALGAHWVWEYQVMHRSFAELYPADFVQRAAPIYATVLVMLLAALGAYRKPWRIRPVALAVVLGFTAIATLNFIFKELNFSRGTVAVTSLFSLVGALGVRALFNLVRTGSLADEGYRLRYVLVGSPTETARVYQLLQDDILYPGELLGLVRPEGKEAVSDTGQHPPVLGDTGQLDEIARFYAVNEVIFCNKSLSTREIIGHMTRLAERHIHFKIVPHGADYLIGPNLILTGASAQPLRARLENPEMRFKKNLFDFSLSFVLLAAYPLTFWLYRHKLRALPNLLGVFTGRYHLVGYLDGTQPELPRIKAGVLNLSMLMQARGKTNAQELQRMDYHYARNYSLLLDWEILVKGFDQLGAPLPRRKAA
ncbi:MAG: glycosyltransferase [Bacteroidetes bacterium]|nr:glycosyltransferase [Bacteroidota bacterium]